MFELLDAFKFVTMLCARANLLRKSPADIDLREFDGREVSDLPMFLCLYVCLQLQRGLICDGSRTPSENG